MQSKSFLLFWMHTINSNKNNSRIINHKKQDLWEDAKSFQEGNAAVTKQTFWPVYSFRTAIKAPSMLQPLMRKVHYQSEVHLILVWGLIPLLGLGFQQATWTDATLFLLTVITTQLLGVTMFSNSPAAEAAILARVSWLYSTKLIKHKKTKKTKTTLLDLTSI